MQTYTYLALGDSYTIGEGVPLYDSFPYQAVQLFRKSGRMFQAPEIIAKTGWTTDELSAGIAKTTLQPSYDLVSLLIGVNNQYRGRTLEEYTVQFEALLQQAIGFAGNHPSHVVVLSIPDWGATPFAAGHDLQKIAREIDAFNMVNQTIAGRYRTHYIDITPGTRTSANDESMLVADKLHPSGKEYARWASLMCKCADLQMCK
ncbi:MAG TPA: SGNH/GDSL hydrolase family protein [Chitinophagaceae bacterium]